MSAHRVLESLGLVTFRSFLALCGALERELDCCLGKSDLSVWVIWSTWGSTAPCLYAIPFPENQV